MNQSVHIQNIGKVVAKPASELKVGDILLYNFGYTSTVKTVEQRGKSVYITVLNHSDNAEYSRRYTKTRLVAMSSKNK